MSKLKIGGIYKNSLKLYYNAHNFCQKSFTIHRGIIAMEQFNLWFIKHSSWNKWFLGGNN